MRRQIADHLDDSIRSVTVAEIAASIVEADTIDLPGLNPIQADIANELFSTAVIIIEIGKEWPLATNIWRITWRLVKPEIGESAIGLRPGIDVLEHTIKDDMKVAAVQFVDQCLEAVQLICGIVPIVNIAVCN